MSARVRWTVAKDANGRVVGQARFCPTCDGNTYVGVIGVNARTCPACAGAGLFWKGATS